MTRVTRSGRDLSIGVEKRRFGGGGNVRFGSLPEKTKTVATMWWISAHVGVLGVCAREWLSCPCKESKNGARIGGYIEERSELVFGLRKIME